MNVTNGILSHDDLPGSGPGRRGKMGSDRNIALYGPTGRSELIAVCLEAEEAGRRGRYLVGSDSSQDRVMCEIAA